MHSRILLPVRFCQQIRIEQVDRPLFRPSRQSLPVDATMKRTVLGCRLKRVPKPLERSDCGIALAYNGLAEQLDTMLYAARNVSENTKKL